MERLLLFVFITITLTGCGPIKSAYVKNAEIADISTAKIGILDIQHCQPGYWFNPAIADATDPNIGKVARQCTAEKRPAYYTAELKKRLSERLGNKDISIVPMLQDKPVDYNPAASVASGKAAGVDYVIAGFVVEYSCPGAGATVGGAVISGLTAALAPVGLSMSTKQVVYSKVELLRIADGKTMGEILTTKIGSGMLGSCSKLVRDIADEVYEQQFVVPVM